LFRAEENLLLVTVGPDVELPLGEPVHVSLKPVDVNEELVTDLPEPVHIDEDTVVLHLDDDMHDLHLQAEDPPQPVLVQVLLGQGLPPATSCRHPAWSTWPPR
jgi:hypothetical protein